MLERAIRERFEALNACPCSFRACPSLRPPSPLLSSPLLSSFPSSHTHLPPPLQAPVGYDRWSYAYRDKGGSKVNQSQRDDHWGGLPYKAGDTVGFLIHLAPRSLNSTSALTSANGKGCDGPPPNYIQFFHHGELCGEIIEKLGKKEGGVAYAITPGVYYPAVSCYSGGRVRANFGPTFVYPPNKDLVKDYKPFSEAAEKSASSSDLVQKLAKQVRHTLTPMAQNARAKRAYGVD